MLRNQNSVCTIKSIEDIEKCNKYTNTQIIIENTTSSHIIPPNSNSPTKKLSAVIVLSPSYIFINTLST